MPLQMNRYRLAGDRPRVFPLCKHSVDAERIAILFVNRFPDAGHANRVPFMEKQALDRFITQ